ncbi:MAG: hypothetical protein ACM3UW_02520 [Bacillota bacterium]
MDQAKWISLKIHMILGLIIATCVVLGVYVMGLFGIHAVWPAFCVMIFFFLMGADVKNIPTIMVGAVSGLIFAFLLVTALTPLQQSIGDPAATLLLVWIAVFVIAALGEVLPMICNNYAFAYFTIALIEIPVVAEKAVGAAMKSGVTDPAAIAAAASKAIISSSVQWGLTAVIGGGAVLAVIIACITLGRKAGILPPAEAGH